MLNERILVTLLFLFGFGFAHAQVSMGLADAMEHARTKGAIKVKLTPESAEPIIANMRRPGSQVFAEVTPIGDLAEVGCRRIQVRITAPGSQLELKSGGTVDLDETFSLGLCAKGRAPDNPFQFAAQP